MENDKDPASGEIIEGILSTLPEELGRVVEMFPSDAADFSLKLSEAKTNSEVAAAVAYAVLC